MTTRTRPPTGATSLRAPAMAAFSAPRSTANSARAILRAGERHTVPRANEHFISVRHIPAIVNWRVVKMTELSLVGAPANR